MYMLKSMSNCYNEYNIPAWLCFKCSNFFGEREYYAEVEIVEITAKIHKKWWQMKLLKLLETSDYLHVVANVTKAIKIMFGYRGEGETISTNNL